MSNQEQEANVERMGEERPEGDHEAQSFGAWLRRQREGREIALREIADASKISLRYLQAFEEERFDVLPSPVFAKGFLRQYAKYVGLDPEDVVNFYTATRRTNELERAEPTETAVPKKQGSAFGLPLVLTVVTLLLLGLVALLSWLNQRRVAEPEPLPVAEAPVPVVTSPPPLPLPEPPPPAEPPPSSPLWMTADFKAECWVEVRIDGRQHISELRVQGESLQLAAERRIELTFGDAGAVEVELNGHPFDLGRGSGEVVKGLVVDLETVRSLEQGVS